MLPVGGGRRARLLCRVSSWVAAVLTASSIGACTRSRQLSAAAELADATCYACHGDAANGNPAPPPVTWHARSADSHQAHLQASDRHLAITCDSCHQVPATVSAPGHFDQGPRAIVRFEGLAAATGGAPATYDPGARTCSGTYCHGAALAGGSNTAPEWGGAAPCGSCHGLPPPAPHPVAGATDCSSCHPYDGLTPRDPATHLDGKVELGGACGACHGIPPVTGAHARHADAALLSGVGFGSAEITRDLAPGPTTTYAFACGNCHDPDPGLHYSGQPQVSLHSALAPAGSLKARNPETASFGAVGCSDIYCHSNGQSPPTYVTTPAFGGSFGRERCRSCHDGASAGTGLSAAHAAHVDPARGAFGCERCHAATVSASTTLLDARKHVDGESEVAFGAFAGVGATYDGATRGCSDVYCHGATLAGGTDTAPVWTLVDGSQAACGTCHGVPPPAPHPQVDTSNGLAVCQPCHVATLDLTGHIVPAALGGKHVDGIVQATGHPKGWLDLSSLGFHAYAANRGLAPCQDCHGAALEGGTAGVACKDCHDAGLPAGVTSWRTNCIMCHGGTYNQTGAPPRATWGNGSDAVRIGAHTAHVTDKATAKGLDCAVCHVKPADALTPGHIDGERAKVDFGGLATSQGATPGWDRATATCAGTYCHGATLSGGSDTSPQWGGSAPCGSCHGVPPPPPHPPVGASGCGQCHPFSGQTPLDPATHVNGTVEIGGACGACHAIPPGSGAHPRHADAALVSGIAFGSVEITRDRAPGPATTYAFGCGNCHDPDPAPHYSGASNVSLHDPLAPAGSLKARNPQTASYSAAGCTDVYCHSSGQSPPTYVATPPFGGSFTTTRCRSCHDGALAGTGLSGAHAAHVDPARGAFGCERCHAATVTDATTLADTRKHVDGEVEVAFGAFAGNAAAFDGGSRTCSSIYCHGATLAGGTDTTPVWTVVDGSQAACGTCHGLPPPAPHRAVDTSSGLAVCRPCHVATVDGTGHLIPAALGGKHVNGTVEATGHPKEWMDTTSTGFHAYAADRGLAACEDCHGAALDGGTAGVACASCHDAALPAGVVSWRTNCVMCHGGTSNQSGAPPRATWGNEADPVRTGAHTLHVTDGALAKAIDCAGCHVKPADALSSGHVDGATAKVSFGGLAVSGGAQPSWDRSAATCAGTYCHGAFANGNSSNIPSWTSPRASPCGTCHGLPPGGDHPNNPLCGNCHDGYTSSVANPALHINGAFDILGFTCTSCHGETGRPATTINPQLAAAPPTDTTGHSTTSSPGVGAHQLHLQAGTLSSAVACGECHVVPTSTSHATGVVEVSFGKVATNGGASSPSWNLGDLTCTATYCHGGFSGGNGANKPVWNAPNASPCGTCHGTPPPKSTGHPQRSDCGTCHPGYSVSSVQAATHVDGKVDVIALTCFTCHGDAGRSSTAKNPLLPVAPPMDTTGSTAASSPGVGAHQTHLLDGPMSSAFTCAECHVVPADLSSHPNGTLSLSWGSTAAAGSVSPTYSGSTCTNYCHGASLQGGTVTQPTWTTVDGTQAVCGACHGLPPSTYPSSAHPRYLLASVRCIRCHPDTAAVSGSGATAKNVIVPGGGSHVNGAVESSFAGHPNGWVDPADKVCGGIHGCLPPPPPETYKHFAYYGPCTTCHGDGFDFTEMGGTSGVSCGACHVNAFASTSCMAQGTDYPCTCDLCHAAPIVVIPTGP